MPNGKKAAGMDKEKAAMGKRYFTYIRDSVRYFGAGGGGIGGIF